MQIRIYYQTIDCIDVEVDDKFATLNLEENEELKNELEDIVRDELRYNGVDNEDMTEVCDNDTNNTLLDNYGHY
jgi:hypothetical protein